MICRLILLMCSFVIESKFSNTFQKKNYNYDIKVFPVDRCPMNESDWQAAAARIGCNDIRGYHCVPDKFHESLIEFCYYRSRILVSEGNCLELAANGILNYAKCQNFTWGCPDKTYFSDRIYNYPTCLTIVIGCFTSDITCLRQKVKLEENVTTTEHSVKETCKERGYDTKESSLPSYIINLATLLVFIVYAPLITCVFLCRKRFGRRSQFREDTLLEKNDNQQKRDIICSKTNPTYKTKSVQAENNDDEDDSAFEDEPLIFVEKKERKCLRIDNLQKLHNLIIHGEDKKLCHFCQEFDKESLEKMNHRGFNALHISAKCGNLNIFQQILKFNVDIESLTADGRNSLHIVAFFGSHSICKYILERRKDLFDVTDEYNMNPAHWAALAGQVSILELLSQYGCNLSVRTPKYEENIVMFACIGESFDVCKFVACNKDIAEILHATNSVGWNSIQYAAKSGNLKVFSYLCEMGVNIRNKSKQTGKNCLHRACEKGNIEICRYIMEERNNRTLITQLDKHEQHVGHFAAKSGNVEILELLIEKLSDIVPFKPALLENATTDNINILHIACRHARVDMCVKIADLFPDLLSEKTEKGWNAALFITEKAEAENDRIMILKFLEKRGLNVYHVTKSGKTILYNACLNRSAELVKYLLNNYPDLLNIEKSMDSRKVANSQEIENVFKRHLEEEFYHYI